MIDGQVTHSDSLEHFIHEIQKLSRHHRPFDHNKCRCLSKNETKLKTYGDLLISYCLQNTQVMARKEVAVLNKRLRKKNKRKMVHLNCHNHDKILMSLVAIVQWRVIHVITFKQDLFQQLQENLFWWGTMASPLTFQQCICATQKQSGSFFMTTWQGSKAIKFCCQLLQ